MAACCANVTGSRGGWSSSLTLPSDRTRQPSSATLFRGHCADVSPCTSWASSSSLQCPRLTNEARAPRSWSQQRPHLQPRAKSPSPSSCSAADVSFDATSTDPNFVDGNGTGMSIEERDAILAFEGLSRNEIAEEGNSSERQQLSSKEEPDALRGMTQSEDVTTPQRRPELYETASKAVRGQGAAIANVIILFITLLDSPSAGSGKIIAGAGSAALERVEEEVGKLREAEGVDGQSLFEILRLVKLLRMDVQLIAATRKDSTLSERLEQAKAHCRKILSIVSTLSR